MSRLYLDLRHAAEVPDHALGSFHSEEGYLTRVVGSLGGSIVFEADSDDPSADTETESSLSISDAPDNKPDSIEMIGVSA